MTKIGFLHFTNAPTDNAANSFLDVDCTTSETCSKTVVLFHNESTFTSNEDQPTQWGMKGDKMMKPKSKGVGIMVSDFVDEHSGFLWAKTLNPRIHKYTREFLEYGESREGYDTRQVYQTSGESNRGCRDQESKGGRVKTCVGL